MPYVPDATQVTEPIDLEKASSMGLEFRTLKAYIQNTVIAGLATKVSLSGVSTFAAASRLNFPYTAALEGIISGDGTSFTYDTTKIIAAYGLSWKVLSGVPSGAVAFLSGFGGIYFVTDSVIQASIDNVGLISTLGTINCGGNLTAASMVKAGTAAGIGYANMHVGDATHSGYIEFYNHDGTRKAYIGYGLAGAGNGIALQADEGASWNFSSPVIATGFQGPLTGAASTADHITNNSYNGFGVRTVSTSAPSGGADGDIWYQV